MQVVVLKAATFLDLHETEVDCVLQRSTVWETSRSPAFNKCMLSLSRFCRMRLSQIPPMSLQLDKGFTGAFPCIAWTAQRVIEHDGRP